MSTTQSRHSTTSNTGQLVGACILSALAFGTAWAVRGKFGHEQGAAWAGSIGAIGVILVARRQDWYDRLFDISLAAAFGWGLSGMISYGMVVGYARADDFANIAYGLVMLFVIGLLYGFLGGGMFALSLSNTREQRVPWAVLIAEMVAFGLAAYGLIVNQLGWLMTPPRSELWAACLGACIPVAWHAVRTNRRHVLRVAVWSALGAGWGFAFGNFLQVMANSVEFPMNPWNIMEYSIGFFGGLGMSYGTLTSEWPLLDARSPGGQNVSALVVLVLIPFTVWDQSFVAEKMKHVLASGGTESTVVLFQWIAAVVPAAVAILIWQFLRKNVFTFETTRSVFILYLGAYILLSFLLTGVLVHPVEQYLYLLNVVIVLIAVVKLPSPFAIRDESSTVWLIAAAAGVLALSALTLVILAFNTKMMETVGRF